MKTSSQFAATIIMQIRLLNNWCKANGWSEPQIADADFQFYAIPPESYIPIPLPREALTEVDKYRDILFSIWEIERLEKTSEIRKDKALVFNIGCFLLLCIKYTLSNPIVENLAAVVYIVDTSIFLSEMITIVYAYTAISDYWEGLEKKKQLNRSSEFRKLLTKLENS